jgi:hypothetical protein
MDSPDTGYIGHKTQNEDKQRKKHNIENSKMNNMGHDQKLG